jgi:hypothetical protein
LDLLCFSPLPELTHRPHRRKLWSGLAPVIAAIIITAMFIIGMATGIIDKF